MPENNASAAIFFHTQKKQWTRFLFIPGCPQITTHHRLCCSPLPPQSHFTQHLRAQAQTLQTLHARHPLSVLDCSAHSLLRPQSMLPPKTTPPQCHAATDTTGRCGNSPSSHCGPWPSLRWSVGRPLSCRSGGIPRTHGHTGTTVTARVIPHKVHSVSPRPQDAPRTTLDGNPYPVPTHK